MNIERIGVLGFSTHENERRYPIHKDHLVYFDKNELSRLYFEKDYPNFNAKDQKLNFLTRSELFKSCDLIIIPKPTTRDYHLFSKNQVLWGWMHAVQGIEITQKAIDSQLTLLAWESMYRWNKLQRGEHIFARNNELAGYASVIHALSINGITSGSYGQSKRIAVIGYGSTGKGAVNALLGLGCSDLTVYSRRNRFEIQDAINNVKYETYSIIDGNASIGIHKPIDILKDYDIIVNCILQDPNRPITFIYNNEINELKEDTIIIDVSCDREMGFEFSSPTTFENPQFRIGKAIYYSVDHTPSFFWNSASYEISGALLPYLKYVLKNNSILGCSTLENAIEIENGVIKNRSIIDFQKRVVEYPHAQLK